MATDNRQNITVHFYVYEINLYLCTPYFIAHKVTQIGINLQSVIWANCQKQHIVIFTYIFTEKGLQSTVSSLILKYVQITVVSFLLFICVTDFSSMCKLACFCLITATVLVSSHPYLLL